MLFTSIILMIKSAINQAFAINWADQIIAAAHEARKR